jgi:hypothetical protein
MLENTLTQALAWFKDIKENDPESRLLIGKMILQEKDPVKYLTQEPTRAELNKFFSNRTALNVIDKLSNLERAILTAQKHTGYKVDFDFIRFLENATILHVFEARKYTNLSSLNTLKNLQIIHLHECHNLSAFLNIRNFTSHIDLFITDVKDVFFSSFINFTNIQSITIMNCDKVNLKTNQHHKFLKQIRIISCTSANIEIDFAKYPYLTSLVIQDTQGKISFLNTTKARNLSFANIQQLGRTPQIQEILLDPSPQSFELV